MSPRIMGSLPMDCGTPQYWLVLRPSSKSGAIFSTCKEKIAALLFGSIGVPIEIEEYLDMGKLPMIRGGSDRTLRRRYNHTVLPPETQCKLDRLREIIRSFGSVLVAYSGGVDSALVMAIAHEELGERAVACIGVSPSYPTREMRDAVKLAELLGVPFRLVGTEEHLDARYAANPGNRCYFCKSELHDQLGAIASAEGWAAVADGNNASDVGDDRPGMTAARERGVRSPLLEAGITKEEVRAIAKELNLPVWDKPAMACLSSRVPTGTPITPELLRQIESAEDVLASLGFRQFRVRHHGEVARIELPAEELGKAIEVRERIVEGITRAGYRFVSLDLGGFRSGSLNVGEAVYAVNVLRSSRLV